MRVHADVNRPSHAAQEWQTERTTYAKAGLTSESLSPALTATWTCFQKPSCLCKCLCMCLGLSLCTCLHVLACVLYVYSYARSHRLGTWWKRWSKRKRRRRRKCSTRKSKSEGGEITIRSETVSRRLSSLLSTLSARARGQSCACVLCTRRRTHHSPTHTHIQREFFSPIRKRFVWRP
jgi:hypothetical protein